MPSVSSRLDSGNLDHWKKPSYTETMRVKRHFFPPQKKIKVLSSAALFLYLTFFLLFHLTTNIIVRYYPGILGTTSAIRAEDLIRLTNEQRTKNGLPPLKVNPGLIGAAARKGEDMFSENYWAHISPSGQDPWYWIDQTGYDYLFAGENLAKDFVRSGSVVSAWMASPSHRANILNEKFEEIGIAVLDGSLNGYQTTLVVQMLATPKPVPVSPPQMAAQPEPVVPPIEGVSPAVSPAEGQLAVPSPPTFLISSTRPQKPPLVEPFYLVKVVSLGLVLLLLGIFSLDVWAVATGRLVKVGSHSLAHAVLLGILLLAIIYTNVGVIA